MNQWLQYVPGVIYGSISITTFLIATASYRRKEIFFKKGLMGTSLLHSKTVLYVQIVSLYICSFMSAFFASVYFLAGERAF